MFNYSINDPQVAWSEIISSRNACVGALARKRPRETVCLGAWSLKAVGSFWTIGDALIAN
jgi:hypothetical protein